MALIVGLENEFGGRFNYHKISRVTFDFSDEGSVNVYLSSYQDEEARKDGRMALLSELKVRNVSGSKILKEIYKLIKDKFPVFKDACDELGYSGKKASKTKHYEMFSAGHFSSWMEDDASSGDDGFGEETDEDLNDGEPKEASEKESDEDLGGSEAKAESEEESQNDSNGNSKKEKKEKKEKTE